jgi:hypothetical protein
MIQSTQRILDSIFIRMQDFQSKNDKIVILYTNTMSEYVNFISVY